MNAFLVQNVATGEAAIIVIDSDGIIVAVAIDGDGNYRPDRSLDVPTPVDLSEWRVLR